MIQLKDTNAYAIPVPVDATEIQFGNHCLGFKSNQDFERDSNGWCIISLGLFAKNKYTILGTATKEHISFDAESIVDKIDGTYPDYRRKDLKKFLIAEYSFHSLMIASGCYYENPFGEKPHFSLFKWQQAQKNTSEKWVIIKKVE